MRSQLPVKLIDKCGLVDLLQQLQVKKMCWFFYTPVKKMKNKIKIPAISKWEVKLGIFRIVKSGFVPSFHLFLGIRKCSHLKSQELRVLEVVECSDNKRSCRHYLCRTGSIQVGALIRT